MVIKGKCCLVLLLFITGASSMTSHSNPLEGQKSPYLLQHAHNPVNWYPWSDQAFKKAADEGKPIFLSIGYATCHWCHVMEKESFENDEVAAILNKSFISIKVDREERPDIDNVYMSVCQALTGTGGWPLTIIMTPDKKPFFAATYIPRESRFGMTGLLEILPKLADLWKNKKDDVLSSAEKVSAALKGNSDKTFAADIGEGLCNKAADEISSEFDKKDGGFGNAPKFPSAHRLLFLIRQARVSGDKEILRQVEFTLDKMRAGGIHDQLGGGFHRYSTDAKWLLPHFEKMLYDQAMLVMAYVEAYQNSGKEEYVDTARDAIVYVMRDMTSKEGAFYSAEDADSEGEEGKFYVWKYDEVFSALEKDEALVAVRYFNVDDQGNYTDPIHGGSMNNILHLGNSHDKLAGEFDKTVPEMKSMILRIRSKMLDHRSERTRPLRDTKILADWNGLMIAAIAKFAGAVNSESHLNAATRAADFILEKMRYGKGGGLYHRYIDGELAVEGQLDDYAFMIWGLLELYEAGSDEKYLSAAMELDKVLSDSFHDVAKGAYFMTSEKHENLIFRPKVNFDGALPSGNSVQMMNLLRLSALTGNPAYEEKAFKILKSVAELVNRYPGSFTNYLSALLYSENSTEVVVVGKKDDPEAAKFAETLRKTYQPFMTLISVPAGNKKAGILKIAEFAKDYKQVDGKTTIYVCRKHKCSQPVTDIEEALKMIEK